MLSWLVENASDTNLLVIGFTQESVQALFDETFGVIKIQVLDDGEVEPRLVVNVVIALPDALDANGGMSIELDDPKILIRLTSEIFERLISDPLDPQGRPVHVTLQTPYGLLFLLYRETLEQLRSDVEQEIVPVASELIESQRLAERGERLG